MKRKSLIFVWLVLFGTVTFCLGHEFWLQPRSFFPKPGERVRVDILVGEHFRGETWDSQRKHMHRLVHYRKSQPGSDLLTPLKGDTIENFEVTLKAKGTHLLAFATTNKYIEIEPEGFLAYLTEDGLDNAIEYRRTHNKENAPGREFYRRCVKTLVQVGDTPDTTFALNTGMPLEIVPLRNPYALTEGNEIRFRMLFNGQPLANALVRYWNRDSRDQLTEEQMRTDAQGQASFTLKKGVNMISLVHMVPYENPEEADWQSYWGSLTFACR